MKTFGKISKVKFLDKLENDWAGENNPHRRGIAIRKKKDTILMTDGKGDFWEVYNDEKSRNAITGNLLDDYQKEIDLLTKQNEILRECVDEYEKLNGFPRNHLYKLYAIDLSLWDMVKNKVCHLKEELSKLEAMENEG